jgi:quercetin dioxygenase-like cupin family protein
MEVGVQAREPTTMADEVVEEAIPEAAKPSATSPEKGPDPEDPSERWFTGLTWNEEVGRLHAVVPTRVVKVVFAPESRTAWHRHPAGQVVHILHGRGRVGREGQPVREVRAGETIEFAPGERHWHGATPTSVLVQLAIQPSDAETGRETIWEEHVDAASYNRMGQQPAQELVHPAQEAAQDPVQPAQEPAQESGQPAQEAGQESVQPAQEAAQEPVQPAQEPVEEPAGFRKLRVRKPAWQLGRRRTSSTSSGVGHLG